MALSLLGLIAVLLGTSLGAALGALRAPRPQAVAASDNDRALRDALGLPGALLMFASLSAFVLIGVTSDGLHAFVGGYSNWLQVKRRALPCPTFTQH